MVKVSERHPVVGLLQCRENPREENTIAGLHVPGVCLVCLGCVSRVPSVPGVCLVCARCA